MSLSDVSLDIRFALRNFARRPGFTLAAVLTLALGIGGATAVFSMIDAVLLRPLPYKDPGRLIAVWVTSTREKNLAKLFAMYGDYAEFRRGANTLESISAATWATRLGRVLEGHGRAREMLTVPASASFFDTLGVHAALGRTFRSDDERRGCSLVLAHEFWTSVLGSDRTIAGKLLNLDRKPCTVVGVMPANFSFYPPATQAWVLLGPGFESDQDKMLVGIFARLKPGATIAQTRGELRGLYRGIHASGEFRDFEPIVFDLHGEFTFLAGRTLTQTLILAFAAVLALLLIACVNVGNLLLARLSERGREMAVRSALGSGRGRLIRQVLTESLILSIAGGVLGLALAEALVRYLRAASPIELTVGAEPGVNAVVLSFVVALAAANTLLFGLLPALRASRMDSAQNLRNAGRGTVGTRSGVAKTLVSIEMALSFLLLIGAGLLMSSALRMGSEQLGFNPDGVLTTRVSLPVVTYQNGSHQDDARRIAFCDRLLERLGRIPGATSVAISSKMPPQAGGNQIIEIEGRRVESSEESHDVGADAVSPGFFELLQTPIVRGRGFTAADGVNSQPVAIVNEALAKKYFPNRDPLGGRLRLKGPSMPWLTVVGVAGNLKHTQLMNEMSWVETPILYRPLAQEQRTSIQASVRTSNTAAARQIEQEIAALDPSIPASDVETLRSRIAKTLAYPRFRATVSGLFAGVALVLSTIGLYGVLSHLVAQRTSEFGVRRAVGAQTRDLILLVAKQGGIPVLAGLGAGGCLTLAFNRMLANLVYGVETTDPLAFAAVGLVLLAVGGIASILPARRAARIDPMTALREE